MARTPSNMIPLGTSLPDFTLTNVITGETYSTQDITKVRGVLIMFICNHCPYVKYIERELIETSHFAINHNIEVIAISSNDINQYPEDAPDKMKQIAISHSYPFCYLYDESQDVARKFDAACTPDFYLFDSNFKLVYRGQFDDSRPGNQSPITGKDLREAIDCLVSGSEIPTNQKPSLGCNIKWKKA